MWGDTKYLLHISLKLSGLPKESGAAASNPLSTCSATPQLSKRQSDLKKWNKKRYNSTAHFFMAFFLMWFVWF